MKRKVWFFVGGGLLLVLLFSFLFSGFFLKITGQPFLNFDFGGNSDEQSDSTSGGSFITDRTYVIWMDDSGKELSEYIYSGEEDSVIAKVGGLDSSANGKKALFKFYTSDDLISNSTDQYISSGIASAWFDINEEIKELVGDGGKIYMEVIIGGESKVFDSKKYGLTLNKERVEESYFTSDVDVYWMDELQSETITNFTYYGKSEAVYVSVEGLDSSAMGKKGTLNFYKYSPDVLDHVLIRQREIGYLEQFNKFPFFMNSYYSDLFGNNGSMYIELIIEGEFRIFDSFEDRLLVKNGGPEKCSSITNFLYRCKLEKGQYLERIRIKEISDQGVKFISGSNEETPFLKEGETHIFLDYNQLIQVESFSAESVSFLVLKTVSGSSSFCYVIEEKYEENACFLYPEQSISGYSFEKLDFEIKDPSLDANLLTFKIRRGKEVSKSLGLKGVYLFEDGKIIYINDVELFLFENKTSGEFEILPMIYFYEGKFKESNDNFNLNGFFARGFWGLEGQALDEESSLASYNTYYYDHWSTNFPETLKDNTLFFLDLVNIRDPEVKSIFSNGYEFYNWFILASFFEKNSSGINKAYFIADEAPWLGIPYELVEERYDFFDKYDPNVPTWINFAFVDKQGDLRTYKNNLKLYGDRADIVSLDYYGSFDWVEDGTWGSQYFITDNHGIDAVGDYMDILKDVFGDEKPIWFISQAYAESPRDSQIVDRDIRFMPYQAIVHGAKGILFFGLHVVPEESEKNEIPKKEVSLSVLKELEEMEGFLAGSPVNKFISKDAVGAFDGIEYIVFERGSEFVAIIVNRKDQTFSKTFDSNNLGINLDKLEGLVDFRYVFSKGGFFSLDKLERIEEKVEFDSGEFTLDFSSYQVYILKGKIEDQGFSFRDSDKETAVSGKGRGGFFGLFSSK